MLTMFIACELFLLKHVFVMLPANAGAVLLMVKKLCLRDEVYHQVASEYMGAVMFASGISTLIQTTVGVRLIKLLRDH